MTLPFENDTSAVIQKLTRRSLKANKRRNFFLVMAIMLTTLLIGSVFSVGMSLVESVKMEQIHLAGTMAHAAVGHPTASQIEQLHNLDYVKAVGTGNSVGYVENTAEMGNISLTLHYFDETEWEELRAPAYVDVEGNYPEKENEIMVSRAVLERMGIANPSIGMEIPLAYYTDSDKTGALMEETFCLSGWFTSYAFVQSTDTADVIFVSQELSQKYGKTVEADGSVSVRFVDETHISEYCDALVSDLGLSENQPIATVQLYDTSAGQETATLLSLCAVAVFLIFTGYLLIYNILYISISRDVRFYGLLKTLGATPKQIKRVIRGQILRLCLIGIPVGIVLSLILSLGIVPFFISALDAVSADGAVVSFSPLIYVGAIIFPLFTAMLGASKPAKKAASISPIEAQKYTGVTGSIKGIRSVAHGKPVRMAWRNIFRDKKRTGIVLLSLFLGVTTFLTVTTLVFSTDISKYIDSTFESDFVLKNSAWPAQSLDNSLAEQLMSIPGTENLHTTTWEEMSLEYSDDFREYIANHPMREQITGLSEQAIADNFKGFLLGVDGETLTEYRDALGNPIDVEAFERGEIALIATDNPELFSNIEDLTVMPSYRGESGTSGNQKYELSLGGFVPFNHKGIGASLAPTLVVSNEVMQEWFEEPVAIQLELNVSSGYEQNALIALKQIIEDNPAISLTSRIEAMAELGRAKMAILILGGSISLVIALIGILNFVNIMSVSVVARKRELATLESIGMSRKQIRKMLISEGLCYAGITLILVLSIGNLIAYGIFKLFQQQVSFAVFTYPLIPAAIIALVILTVCLITPERMYCVLNKETIVNRLREAE
ncbi:ABC transporter permease [Agathobaculum sp. Marseille-P7918]|uniref:ABC transporter permease n=1 Tax=Agathobaculum sp. Marseille-P7918 TaxID=2479843 RepID=UPI003566B06E